jgi:tetratricopeptide (TPR) repeat protein
METIFLEPVRTCTMKVLWLGLKRAVTLTAGAAMSLIRFFWTRALAPAGRWLKPRITTKGVVTFAILVLIIVLVFVKMRRNVFYLEPITVPNQYSDGGFTSDYLTRRIEERLESIQNAFAAPGIKIDFAAEAEATFEKVEIPETGISIGAAENWLLKLAGREPRLLSARFAIKQPGGCIEILRRASTGSPVQAETLCPPADTTPDGVATEIADRFMGDINPYSLGVFYLSSNDWKRASNVGLTMVSTPGETNRFYASAHILLGYAAQQQGDLDKAHREFTKAADIDVYFPNAQFMLAQLAMSAGNQPEAVSRYKKAIALDKKEIYPDPHINLGSLLEDQKDVDGAIAEERKAIRIAPKDPDGHLNLGVILCDSGKIGDGLVELKRAVDLAPSNANAHLAFGIWLSQNSSYKNLAQATDELYWASSLDSNDPQALLALDGALNEQQRSVELRAVEAKLCETASNNVVFRKRLVEILTKGGCFSPWVHPTAPI